MPMLSGVTLRMAFRALMANRMRSFLTVLGIIIGVAAVVALVALGQGATSSVESSVEGLGTNLLVVSPGGVSSSGTYISPQSAPITLADEKELAAAVPAVRSMAPVITTGATLAAGTNSAGIPLEATTAGIEQVRTLHLAEGSFFTAAQVTGGANVVVLGSQAADDLYGSTDPGGVVGSTLTINGLPFTLEGILQSMGASGATNQDDVAFVPITTAMAELTGQVALSSVYASARSQSVMNLATEEITDVLNAIEGQPPGSAPQFTVTSQTQVLSTLSSVTSTLTTLLGAIAAISLLVGGIGIMNIMLVSVTERTREIGVRKAVGARRADILSQFVLEAVMLSISGGVIGVLVGTTITLVGGRALGIQGSPSAQADWLALAFSAAVGIVFGAYPALRAARLMPMQALRYE
jgi:putative ABC transport system permease protein